jgi:hypothetical protein
MNSSNLREKAALCLRIASRLSWNNPTRLQLTDLADRFNREAKEIELRDHQAQQTEIARTNAAVVKVTRSRTPRAAANT